MKVEPFIKCLNPVYIVNKYTGEPIITSCGKCKACLLSKASNNSLRCQLESLYYKYCMFVTLTYDNEHIPVADYELYFDDMHREFVCLHDSDVVLSDVEFGHNKMRSLVRKLNLNGKVPYLRSSDIQNFLKRFRKNLSNCNYENFQFEKIRYYAVGELGPLHFRPHWHLLLWFDEQRTFSYFSKCLYKAWPFGRIDFSLSRGNCASYCASYVNSSVNLPRIYQAVSIRPKQFHSKNLGEKVFGSQIQNPFKIEPRKFAKISIPLNGVNTEVSMWRTLKTKILPRCKNYCAKSKLLRMYSYTLYEKVFRYTQIESAYLQAKYLAELVINYGFDSYDNYKNLPNYMYDVICYFKDSFSLCDISLVHSPTFKYGVSKTFSNYDELFEMYIKLFYGELKVSKKFCDYCKQYNFTSDKLVDLLDSYYSSFDYESLKQFYNQQNQYLKYGLLSPNQVYYMYTNIPSWFLSKDGYLKRFVLDSALFKMFDNDVGLRFNRSIKHKKQNDANKIFC